MTWFLVTTLIFWLPAIRGAFDGSSYQWGLAGLGGRGTAGDYWFPIAGSIASLFVGLAGAQSRRWALTAIAAWNVVLGATAMALAISSPDDFRFRGDTLGIDISLAWLGPSLFAAASVVAIIAATRAHRAAATSPDAIHAPGLLLLAAALPVQFVLLRFGQNGSAPDQVGVLLTIAQWVLVERVTRPSPRHAARR